MEEDKITIEQSINPPKYGFFKKMWYSITNFDKYLDMALQGPYKAFTYTIELTIFMCLLLYIALGVNYVCLQGIPQDLTNGNIVNFLISEEMKTRYLSALSLFLQYFTIIVTYIVILAIIGYITARIVGIKLRYQAVYSIASYAITLSTFIYTSYLIANIFTVFKMKYIAIAYIAISYVYIATAIFLLKSDIIKKHQELMRIIEEQKRVKQELERKKQEEEKDKNKDTGKEDKDKDEEDKNSEEGLLEEDNNTKEPDGSEA